MTAQPTLTVANPQARCRAPRAMCCAAGPAAPLHARRPSSAAAEQSVWGGERCPRVRNTKAYGCRCPVSCSCPEGSRRRSSCLRTHFPTLPSCQLSRVSQARQPSKAVIHQRTCTTACCSAPSSMATLLIRLRMFCCCCCCCASAGQGQCGVRGSLGWQGGTGPARGSWEACEAAPCLPVNARCNAACLP